GRSRESLPFIDRATYLVQRAMESLVFSLPVGGERRLGREQRARAEDGKFLVDDPQSGIFRFGLRPQGPNLPAIRAVVVEELSERRVALGISTHRAARIAKDLFGMGLEVRARVGLLLGRLACL